MSAHFVAWHTVFDPKMPKMGLFWAKIMFWDRKSCFWRHPPKLFVASRLDTRTTTFIVLTALHGELSGSRHGQFGPIFLPQNLLFFTLHPHDPNFWSRIWSTWCDHIIPKSWGNFWNLQIFGGCPFDRLAGHFWLRKIKVAKNAVLAHFLPKICL